jgi:RNA polymerase sigma-70 factor, ECF subfamily
MNDAATAAGRFGHSVSMQRPYLVRFARQRLHDAALVEDVVQETLLAALRGAAGYAGKASLRTWLTGILLHRIADQRRSERRHPVAPQAVDAGDDEGETSSTSDPVDSLDPPRLLESRQLLDTLRRGIETLPPVAARVFTLRDIEGLSNEETARQLGIDAGRCSLVLHRARSRLRTHLELHWIAPANPRGRAAPRAGRRSARAADAPAAR